MLKYIFCFLSCFFYLFAFNIKQHKSFDKMFNKLCALPKESDFFALLVQNHIILIGSISRYHNLKHIIEKAKGFSRTSLRSKKIYNFIIYEHFPENKKLESLVFKKVAVQVGRQANKYLIFCKGQVVWVIGEIKTFYEKLILIEVLENLKQCGVVNKYYLFVKFKPSKKYGFVYRHKI